MGHYASEMGEGTAECQWTREFLLSEYCPRIEAERDEAQAALAEAKTIIEQVRALCDKALAVKVAGSTEGDAAAAAIASCILRVTEGESVAPASAVPPGDSRDAHLRPCDPAQQVNQVGAFRDTVDLAEKHGLPAFPGTPVGLDHLRKMLTDIESRRDDFDEAKLGRWLGYAQGVLIAADVGPTLDDVKSLNTDRTR